MTRAIAENHSHYVQTTGVPRLRELIAEKLRRSNAIPILDVEDVLVTNGGIHGLYILCRSLLDPGDEVLIPDPAWPPAAGNILAAQGVPVGYTLHESTRLAAGPRRDRSADHAKDDRAVSQFAEQSDRRRADARLTSSGWRRSRRARSLGDLRRSLRGRRLRRRARQHRVAAGHVRAHDSRSTPSASRTR